MGKTYFLDYIIRTLIKLDFGVCLIDPMGGLYRRMLKFAEDFELADRTILIDPNDKEWAVGLNMLEFDPEASSLSSHVEEVMNETGLVLGQPTGDFRPQVDRWSRDSYNMLAQAKLSMVELSILADPDNPVLRKRLLRECNIDYTVRDEWGRFDNYPHPEKVRIMDAIMNRANPFETEHARRIFGQLNSTIDFVDAMNTGKLILVNLDTGAISEKERRMLGIEVIYKIMRAAKHKSRTDKPKERRRPFFVFIDEFGIMVNEQIIEALDTMRQLRVFFWLSHQRLDQLRAFDKKHDSNLCGAVMDSTRLKFAFRVPNPDDAHEMAERLFPGEIRGDIKKFVLKTDLFAPRLEWMTIKSRTKGSTSGETTGSSRGSGTSVGSSFSHLNHYRIGDGFFAVPDQISAGEGKVDVLQNSEHYTDSRSSVWTDTNTESTTEVPVTVYDREKQVSSVQFYSLDEVRQMFGDRIRMQDVREMLFSVDTDRAIPLITPEVKDIRSRKNDIWGFKREVYNKYAKPTDGVQKEIEERRQKLLTATEQEKIEFGLLPKSKGKRSGRRKQIQIPVATQSGDHQNNISDNPWTSDDE